MSELHYAYVDSEDAFLSNIACRAVERDGVRHLLDQPDRDCGCPERFLIVDRVHTVVHFEANGSCEAFYDAGDWIAEAVFHADDLDRLQEQAVNYLRDVIFTDCEPTT